MEYWEEDEEFDSEEEYDININTLERNLEESYEEELMCSEKLFEKLKFYRDFHNLNYFTCSDSVCVSNLMIIS